MNKTLQYLTNRLEFLDKREGIAIKDGDIDTAIEVGVIKDEVQRIKIMLSEELPAIKS